MGFEGSCCIGLYLRVVIEGEKSYELVTSRVT